MWIMSLVSHDTFEIWSSRKKIHKIRTDTISKTNSVKFALVGPANYENFYYENSCPWGTYIYI